MKRVLLAILLLSLSASAQMWPMPGPGQPVAAAPPAGGYSVVNATIVERSGSASPMALTVPSTTSGNTLLFFRRAATSHTWSYSDNQGSTYASVYQVDQTTDGIRMALSCVENVTAGITTITVTPGQYQDVNGVILEVTGVGCTADGVSTASRSSYSNSGTCGSITTTNANDVVFCQAGMTGNGITFSPDSTYTADGTLVGSTSDASLLVQRLVVSATGTYNPSYTHSGSAGYAQAVTVALRGK